MKPWAPPNTVRVRISHHTGQSQRWTPITTKMEEQSAMSVTVMPQATMARPARNTYRPATCDEIEVSTAEGTPTSAAINAEIPCPVCNKIATETHTEV